MTPAVGIQWGLVLRCDILEEGPLWGNLLAGSAPVLSCLGIPYLHRSFGQGGKHRRGGLCKLTELRQAELQGEFLFCHGPAITKLMITADILLSYHIALPLDAT
jgi:hypothetical protein